MKSWNAIDILGKWNIKWITFKCNIFVCWKYIPLLFDMLYDRWQFLVLYQQIFHWNCDFHYTSTKSWRGYIFTSVCLSVCVCVCVCVSVCEQNADRTATPILTRSSLNSCILQSLEPYWNWWPWVQGQGLSDVISIFPS